MNKTRNLIMGAVIFVLSSWSQANAQVNKGTHESILNISPSVITKSQKAFAEGSVCYIWGESNISVKPVTDGIEIGPFFVLSYKQPIQYKTWITIPGQIFGTGPHSANPSTADTFKITLSKKQMSGNGKISIQLLGFGAMGSSYAGKMISNIIEIEVDINKNEVVFLSKDYFENK